MKKVVKFIGQGKLPIAVYKKGRDSSLKVLQTGDIYVADEDVVAFLQPVIDAGLVTVQELRFGAELHATGTADVWDDVGTANQTATVTHTVGSLAYEVLLSHDDYEVVNKTTTDFQVRLKSGATGAGADINYVILK